MEAQGGAGASQVGFAVIMYARRMQQTPPPGGSSRGFILPGDTKTLSRMKLHVVLEPQEEGGYTVWCVEVPGAISQGETKAEALENIQDAIRELVSARIDDARKHAKATRSRMETLNIVPA